MTLYCLSWIRDLVVGKDDEEEAPLPDDVSAEILVRLPADDIVKCRTLFRQWDSLTSTLHFIRLHLQRATPTLYFQFYVSGDLVTHKSGSREFIYCEGDSGKNKSNYFSEIHSKSLKKLSRYWPWLRGSRDGLLLFEAPTHIQAATKFFVINPVIEEHVSVIPPVKPGTPCSIFFHPTTKDYVVLFYHHHCYQYHNTHPGYCYRYFTYSLWAKTWKEITCFKYRPTPYYISTVLVNGCLHWIPVQEKDGLGDFPPCEDGIMVYSIDTEEFHTLPHPGPKCRHTRGHQWMCLFEMENRVAFCYVQYLTNGAVIYIWVLEDYGNWDWVMRYKLDLGWMKVHYSALPNFYDNNCTPNRIKLLNILNDELLFDWSNKGVFCYNLKHKRVRKITTITGMDWWRERYGMAVTYTQSLVRPSLSPRCTSSC